MYINWPSSPLRVLRPDLNRWYHNSPAVDWIYIYIYNGCNRLRLYGEQTFGLGRDWSPGVTDSWNIMLMTSLMMSLVQTPIGICGQLSFGVCRL